MQGARVVPSQWCESNGADLHNSARDAQNILERRVGAVVSEVGPWGWWAAPTLPIVYSA